MYIYNKIQKLKAAGKNISQIAKEENLDWKTVKKYFDNNTLPQSLVRKHRTRKDPLVGFYEKIQELNKLEGLSKWDIFNELVNQNYTGSYYTVNRYLNSIRLPKKERFFEQTYEPGDELQVDFKEELEVYLEGKIQFINLFFGSSPYSSKIFVKSFPALNFECFANGLASMFEYFDGIPKKVRQDNLKPCVSSILKGKSRIYTEKYNKFIEYYGYEVSPCNPARGNEKGHVERDIQTFSNRIKSRLKIEKKEFHHFNELNDWLLETISKMQINCEEKFKEEQLKLNPKRERKENLETHTVVVTGSKYGTIRFGKSVYSIPDGYIERNLNTVASSYDVKIYDMTSNKLVATHTRQKDNSESILIEHVVYSLLRKPSALLSWKHRGIILNDPVLSVFYSQIKKQDSYNAEKKLLQVLNLIQHTTLSEIKVSIELWLESSLDQPPYQFIRELIIEERRPETNFYQNKLNPNLGYYDQFLKGEENVHIH